MATDHGRPVLINREESEEHHGGATVIQGQHASNGAASSNMKGGDLRLESGEPLGDKNVPLTGVGDNGKVILLSPGQDNTAKMVLDGGVNAAYSLTVTGTGSGGTTGGLGSATFQGKVNATEFTLVSDRRLKTNITDVSSCLDSVLAMRPVYYELREDSGKSTCLRQIGFVAQEMQDALPRRGEGVVYKINEEGYLGISYNKVAPIIVGAMKEQQLEIDGLKTKHQGKEKHIKELKEQNSQLRVMGEARDRDISNLKQALESSVREIEDLKKKQEAQRVEHEELRLIVEKLLSERGI